MIVQAKDPSVDRLPVLQMDINTTDETGMVVLPVHSNSVAIDASARDAKTQSFAQSSISMWCKLSTHAKSRKAKVAI